MAETEIRDTGEMDTHTQMILGQLRKVFQPDWIQHTSSDRLVIFFKQDNFADTELKRFMSMYGYECYYSEYNDNRSELYFREE